MKRGVKSLALAAMVLAGGISHTASARAEDAKAPQTVVELFTSQGCSSCPPADALLRELSKRPDVIALSIHVNYWDYIGWKDPFASDESTARQHLYAASLRQRYVYTPEMVIDGFRDVTGSRESDVKDLIREAETRDRPRVPVSITPAGDGKVEVALPAAETDGKATVWMFAIDSEHVTPVARGENGGRTLTNANVVREVKKLGEWTGDPLQLTAEVPADKGRDAFAVVVQKGEAGPVIGAAMLRLR
jgi:hypothetical protein